MVLSAKALSDYRLVMEVIDRKRAVLLTRLEKNKRRRLKRVTDRHIEPIVPTPQSRDDWLRVIHGKDKDDD